MLINHTELTTSSEELVKAGYLDAIVNSSNTKLYGDTGINGVIHRAAGDELRTVCMKLGGCKTGEAKITPAFNIPCKYIIHTVGPVWQDGNHGEEILLEACYRNVLKLAAAHKIRKLGFSSIATGKHGMPGNEAALIAVKTVIAFIREKPESFDRIIWFPYSADTKQAYDNVISMVGEVSKIKANDLPAELPVYNIGIDSVLIYGQTINLFKGEYPVIPARGVLSVIDQDGDYLTRLVPVRFCKENTKCGRSPFGLIVTYLSIFCFI